MQTGSAKMAPSQNFQMSGSTWLARLQQIGRQGKWQQVLQYLEEVPADVAPEVAYSMAIVTCGRSSHWQRCLELLWGGQDIFVPNMVVVGSTLGVLSKASKWKQADALLTWFWQSRAANTTQNSTVLYNCTIDSVASASKWQTARFLLNQSRLRSAQPDIVTYTSSIKMGEMTTQWRAAVSLLKHGSRSDLIVFNASMSSCSKASLWQRSQILLNELSRAKLESETISFNTISSACEKAQQWTLAIQTFAHLRTISIEADVVSFSVAVQAASRKPSYGSGGWQVCCELLGELQVGQVQPDWVLLAAITETAVWQLTLILLQQHFLCREAQEGNILFNSAMSTCVRRATWLRAQGILQKSKAQNQADVASYTSLIRSCTSGNWPFAHAVLEELRWRRLKADAIACSASIKTCDAVGEWRRASSTLTAFENVQPDIVVYNDSISACAKDAQWQQSQQFFLTLQLLGLCINNATLNTVLQAHDASEWQKANHLFAKYRESVQADLVAFSTVSVLSERAGKQLSATKLLSSVEAACQSELKGEQRWLYF